MMDTYNAMFELIGSLFICRSILLLHKAKCVRGIWWAQAAFWTVWALFNTLYYPHINQPLSTLGGYCVLTANAIWSSQMMYYVWKERK